MSRLAEIQEVLLDTNVAIAEINKAMADDPNSVSLLTMAKSLKKQYQNLETDFINEANNIGIDVCSYRVFNENNSPSIKGLSSVLNDFQNLVSVVYDAIKTAIPKARARISAEIEAETEFKFGYTFPGSVGVVLTIPNQRFLIGESFLDESLKTISEMVNVRDSFEVLKYSNQLGAASVRALYKWAYDHAESGLGVDMEWRRQKMIHTHLFAQKPEFERLYQTINFTSDEKISEDTVYANFVGIDVDRRSFHIKLDTGEEIKGALSESVNISEKQTIELPKRYIAHIRKTQKILYSTEEEKTYYNLLSLEPLE